MSPIWLGINKVLVLGLGRTGSAVVDALRSEDVAVRVSDDEELTADGQPGADAVRAGAELASTKDPETLLEGIELVVPSPGVPPWHPVLEQAASSRIPIWSEIELGWRFRRGPVVAVTGTNGKTTTTTLLRAMLEEAGFTAVTAGNIGDPLVSVARRSDEHTVLVCEVSSFQLRFVHSFKPSVAVVLNIAEDHYDWHSDAEDYLASKSRITAFQTPDDHLIVKEGDHGCERIAARSRAQLSGFGLDDPSTLRERLHSATGRHVEMAAGLRSEMAAIASEVRTTPIVPLADIRLDGLHNIENVLAAGCAALLFGADILSVARAATRFEGLAHRMSLVTERDGVRYIDDSKATNPHAAIKALAGLDRVVLIAGGRSKGTDLTGLKAMAPRLKAVVVMGEAAHDLARVFEGLPVEFAADVEDAVDKARSHASPGDTVLLSPACSSLDQYADYAERGSRFAKAVLA